MRRRILSIVMMVLVALNALLTLHTPAHASSGIENVRPGVHFPREALQHRAELKRQAHMVWGLDAPVAVFAAQIHQESRWRADARSPGGALGLTQFKPATARWMCNVDRALCGPAPMNPTWALRALVVYDRWLWQRVWAEDDCERMAFSLAAYNGGLGWVQKRQLLSLRPGVCLGQTCQINPGIAPSSQHENEHYPRVILLQHQALYRTWGPGLCS
jgi:hypothetical protein